MAALLGVTDALFFELRPALKHSREEEQG